MNRIRCIHPIRRITGVLAGLAGALLAFTATPPAAFATRVPPACHPPAAWDQVEGFSAMSMGPPGRQ